MSDDIKRVVTGKVRLSYVYLTSPRAIRQGEKLKYSVTLLIPKADIVTKSKIDAAINAAIDEGVQTKWKGITPAYPAVPIYDGDGVRPSGEGFEPECSGHYVMTASSEYKPEVVDLSMNPIVNPGDIYSGMYGRVSMRFFPYFNAGRIGIGCGLGNVQKLADGEPLVSRTNAVEDFGSSAGTYYTGAVQNNAYIQQNGTYPQHSVSSQRGYGAAPQRMYTQQTVELDPITGAPFDGGVMGL
jgi:hypothetical protein